MIRREAKTKFLQKGFLASLQSVRSALPFFFRRSNPARRFHGGDEARSTGSLHPNLDRRRSDVSATARESGGTARRLFSSAGYSIPPQRSRQNLRFRTWDFYLRRSAGARLSGRPAE